MSEKTKTVCLAEHVERLETEDKRKKATAAMMYLVERALSEAKSTGQPLANQSRTLIEEVLTRGDAVSQAKTTQLLREQTGAKSSSRSVLIGSGVASLLIQFIDRSVATRNDAQSGWVKQPDGSFLRESAAAIASGVPSSGTKATELQWAAGALWNMSAVEDARPQIIKAGAVGALARLVTSGSVDEKIQALGALNNLTLPDREEKAPIALVQEAGGAGLDSLRALVVKKVAGDASGAPQATRARLGGLQVLINVSRPEIWSPTPGRTVAYPSPLGGGGAKSDVFTALVAQLVEIVEEVQLHHENKNVLTPAEMAAGALALLSNMAIDSAERSNAIFEVGGVDFILGCERDGTARQKEEAAKLMQNLRLFESLAAKIDQTQSAADMIKRAKESSDVRVRVRSMRTLALGMELSESMREQMRKSSGGLKWVTGLLDSDEADVAEQAAFVLAAAVLNAPKMQSGVARSKATLDNLVALVSGSAVPSKRHAVTALKRVANSNDGKRYLPETNAKVALQAVLDDAAADEELKAEAQEAIRLLGIPATSRFGSISNRFFAGAGSASSGDLTA